jgi:urocanate reductase
MLAANRIGGYLVGMDFIQSTPGAPAGKKLKIILPFTTLPLIFSKQ